MGTTALTGRIRRANAVQTARRGRNRRRRDSHVYALPPVGAACPTQPEGHHHLAVAGSPAMRPRRGALSPIVPVRDAPPRPAGS